MPQTKIHTSYGTVINTDPLTPQSQVPSPLVNGATGARGYSGSRGYNGSRGQIGFTGSIGATGLSGSRGFTGSRGYVGSRGATGINGSTGATGAAGATGAGATGATGLTGNLGYAGSRGSNGSPGGATGPAGYTGSAGTGSINVWDEDILVGTFKNLNFVGASVVASTQSTSDGGYAEITISAGTGGTAGATGATGYTGSAGGGAVDLSSVSQDIVPDSGDSHDLGSASKSWRYGYFAQIKANGITDYDGNPLTGGITGAAGYTGSAGAGAGVTVDKIYLPAITRLTVTANGSSAYLFDQYSGNNPTIYAISGTTISFDLGSGALSSHPFLIRYAGANYDTGLTHVTSAGVVTTGSSAQGKTSGTLYWKIPADISGSYGYLCSVHGGMMGTITIKNISV